MKVTLSEIKPTLRTFWILEDGSRYSWSSLPASDGGVYETLLTSAKNFDKIKLLSFQSSVPIIRRITNFFYAFIDTPEGLTITPFLMDRDNGNGAIILPDDAPTFNNETVLLVEEVVVPDSQIGSEGSIMGVPLWDEVGQKTGYINFIHESVDGMMNIRESYETAAGSLPKTVKYYQLVQVIDSTARATANTATQEAKEAINNLTDYMATAQKRFISR